MAIKLYAQQSQTHSKRQGYFFLPQHSLWHAKSRGIAPRQTSFVPWALTGACSIQAGSSLEFTGSFCAVLLALCVSGCVHSLIQSCVSGGFCDVHRPKGTPDTGVTNVVSCSDTLTEHTKSQSFLHSIMIPLKFQFIFCAKEGQTHCFYGTWMLLVSF